MSLVEGVVDAMRALRAEGNIEHSTAVLALLSGKRSQQSVQRLMRYMQQSAQPALPSSAGAGVELINKDGNKRWPSLSLPDPLSNEELAEWLESNLIMSGGPKPSLPSAELGSRLETDTQWDAAARAHDARPAFARLAAEAEAS